MGYLATWVIVVNGDDLNPVDAVRRGLELMGELGGGCFFVQDLNTDEHEVVDLDKAEIIRRAASDPRSRDRRNRKQQMNRHSERAWGVQIAVSIEDDDIGFVEVARMAREGVLSGQCPFWRVTDHSTDCFYTVNFDTLEIVDEGPTGVERRDDGTILSAPFMADGPDGKPIEIRFSG